MPAFSLNFGAFCFSVSVIPPSLIASTDTVNTILEYHAVFGNFTGDNTTFPNVTVGRTALGADSGQVFLEGNKNQVVAWTTESDGKVHILNQKYAFLYTFLSSVFTPTFLFLVLPLSMVQP